MTSEQRFGIIAGMGAYLMWGFLPLYLKLVAHIDPRDVLAHRIFWSVPAGFVLVAFAARMRDFRVLLRSKAVLWLGLSSLLIGFNWLTYIWAVGQDRVMEASLGYFLNPLVNVAIGFIFLSEKLRRWQWVAVAIAVVAVANETIALGRLPWVSLVLCFSFAAYGFIRRQVQVDSRVGLTMEVLILLPLALIWFGIDYKTGRSALGNGGWDVFLLALAGPITATPLILFALAAKRLKFSTIGIMQYLGPSIQFVIAIFYGEMLTPLRALTFVLIWMAIIIFSVDALMEDRKRRSVTPV